MGDEIDPTLTAEEDGSKFDAGGSSEGPSSLNLPLAPPSPLTGCYLLIVIGEPYSQEHKDIIIQKLLKGLLSWSAENCHVNLEEELHTITVQALEGEEGKNGERLIQYASENLVTEILIHPQTNTFIQCIRNLLSSFTRHRHIIHAGYTFTGNGSWILQDGTFSVLDFCDAFLENEVQRVVRAYPDTVTIDIHCAQLGHWASLPDKNFTKPCKIRINPEDVLETSNEKLNAFTEYLSTMVFPSDLYNLLESSEVVGNIRFSHPTLYVFPGGQGDAALFGINGFNMLIDGGFGRKACFWDFVRHLDRLDAVLMTRLNNSNICGLSSVIERKHSAHVYPQIGHFFCNLPEKRNLSPIDKDRSPLDLDLIEEGSRMIANLKSINLKAQNCYRDIEPINLYHKVGHGTLDMYIISPSRDSKEVKEFLHKWQNNDQKLFATKDSKEFTFPLQNNISICAMLVWQPANPDDNITRILFPGSTPDAKIFEGLEKVKTLEFLKHPVCTVKAITPSLSTSTISKKALKSGPLDKILSESKPVKEKIMDIKRAVQPDNRTTEEQNNESSIDENKIEKIVIKTVTKAKTVAKTIKSEIKKSSESKKIEADKGPEKAEKEESENKNIISDEKQLKDENEESPIKKDETDTKQRPKISKPKIEVKPPPARSRIDTKPPKSAEKKILKKEEKEQKSSPTTPKKSVEIKQNGAAVAVKEKEIVKAKIAPRTVKASPKSTPAKSTKDANNRKVLEARQKPVVAAVSRITRTEERKVVAKKPIRKVGSPMKVARKDTAIRKPKLDKNETTDSSLVSTPSGDEVQQKKIVGGGGLDIVKQKELIEMKEEQEAVREIEAVFKKDQAKRLSQGVLLDHRELQESINTEPEEEEEYLIIEKEEPYTEESVNDVSSVKDEEEIQKHQRDSDESEKKLKDDSKEKHVVIKEITEEIEEMDQAPDGEAEDEEYKQDIQEEVQDIILSAKEIAKNKMETSVEMLQKTEENSTPSPDERLSSAKKTNDKEENEPNMVESQPDEKFSATSGATTAPTMPEDERNPLDEIKEDLVDQCVEEKHVKEETKESNEIHVVKLPTVFEPLQKEDGKSNFGAQHGHIRDIVKTPDEVADLPMHEVVDYQGYVEYQGKRPDKAEDSSKATETKDEVEELSKQTEETDESAVPETSDEVQPEIIDLDTDKERLEEIEQEIVEETATAEETIKTETMKEKVEAFTAEILGLKSELRETHITTLDSPLSDAKDLKSTDEKDETKAAGYQIDDIKFITFEREDSGLNDIKEEDEDGVSPKQSPEVGDKLSASPTMPPRARTPEDVIKIVAKVAEVLSTDKDLAEIIPDFDEKELERRLSNRIDDTEAETVATVHRMLVTASSEDGGVETEICPQGSIRFRTPTPSGEDREEKEIGDDDEEPIEKKEIEDKSAHSSGKSSPELKTSTTSVEEKDKNEVPEKVKIANDAKAASQDAKQLTDDDNQIDLRRESAFSVVSERDLTKDESSMVVDKVHSRSQSITSNIMELEHDDSNSRRESQVSQDSQNVEKTVEMNIQDIEVIQEEEKQSAEDKDASDEQKEASRPDSKASAHSKPEETEVQSRKQSITSIKSDQKLNVEKDASRPDSRASGKSEKQEESDKQEQEQEIPSADRKESIISTASKKSDKDEEKIVSRPNSRTSITSAKSNIEAEVIESERKASQASIVSKKSDKDDDKVSSRPESRTSIVSTKSDKIEKDEPEIKDGDRKSSQASITSKKSDKEDAESKLDSPERKMSISSDKDEVEETLIESIDNKDLQTEKETSRSASRASVTSTRSEKGVEEQLETKTDASSRKQSITSAKSEKLEVEKDSSRPESRTSVSSKKSEKDAINAEIIEDSSRPASRSSVTSKISEKDIEVERKESIVSVAAKEKLETEKASKSPSRSSITSAKSEKDVEDNIDAVSVKSDQKLDVEKDSSRPLSRTSDHSGKDADIQISERKDSKASIESKNSEKEGSIKSDTSDKLEVEKDSSRPASRHSVGSAKSEKDDQELEKEASRPASRASVTSKAEEIVDETIDQAKRSSRSESRASIASVTSHKDEAIDASSRKDSKTSIDSKKLELDVEESKDDSQEKTEDRKQSIISVTSEQKLEVEKDSSRPASRTSVASEHKDEDEKISQAERKDSKASISSKKSDQDKDETKDEVIETTDDRKQSIISTKSEQKLEVEKDSSRPASRTSVTSNKSDKPETELEVESKIERSGSQASVASTKSEKIVEETSDRKESITSVTSEQKLEVEKEASRPQSQTSKLSEKIDEEVTEKDAQESTEKEPSRTPSQASIKSEKIINESQIESDRKSITSVTSEQKLEVEASDRKESITSVTSEQKLEVEKDASRPQSQASKKSENVEEEVTETIAQIEISRPASQASAISTKSEKHVEETIEASTEKDSSRPASKASMISSKSEKPEEEIVVSDDRKQSTISIKSEHQEEQKEPSRAPSQASTKSDKNAVEEIQSLEIEKEVSRSASRTSVTSKTSDVQEEAPVELEVRKESIISILSEKDVEISKDIKIGNGSVKSFIQTEEVIEPEIVAVDRKESIISVTSEHKLDVPQDISRPDSKASGGSEKSVDHEKEEQTAEEQIDEDKQASRSASRTSMTSAKSDKVEIALEEEKQASRAESRASITSTKSEKAEDIIATQTEVTEHRKESIMSIKSDTFVIEKESAILATKPSNGSVINKDVEETHETTDHSLEVQKDESRPESRHSVVSTKSTKEDEPAIQQPSRPESIASHTSVKSDKIEDTEIQSASRKESIVSTKSDDNQEAVKESSWRDSKTSHVSVKSDKQVNEPETQQPSRPESIASHTSVKSDKIEDSEIPSESRKESIVSTKSDENQEAVKDRSRRDSKTSHVSVKSDKQVDEPETQQHSRPESIASHTSVKSDKIEDSEIPSESRKESIVSTKSDDNQEAVKDRSRRDSKTSHVSVKSDKQVDEPETQQHSRPESIASHTSVKSDKIEDSEIPIESRKESIISTKSDDNQEAAKDISRPDSKTSHVSVKSEKHVDEPETLSDIRKESIISIKDQTVEADASRPDSRQSVGSLASHKDLEDALEPEIVAIDRKESVVSINIDDNLEVQMGQSRPGSNISVASAKSEKDFIEVTASRPDSKASHVSSKSTKDEQEPETQSDIRKESIASIKSDQQKLDVQKDESRPESRHSVASVKSSKDVEEEIVEEPITVERKESIMSVKSEQQETKEELSRPGSKISVGSTKSEKIEEPSVERKESIISTKSDQKLDVEKDVSRPESRTSVASAKSHTDDQKEIITEQESHKEASRPASVTSGGSHKSATIEQTTESRRESTMSAVQVDVEEMSEQVGELQKEASRPDSRTSAITSKSIDNKEKSDDQKSLSGDKVEAEDRAPSRASVTSISSHKSSGIVEHTTEEVEERKQSIISATSDLKIESDEKEASRPHSRTSVVSESGKSAVIESEITKVDSRKASVTSHKEEEQKEHSRAESRTSIHSTVSTKITEEISTEQKEFSRPPSVASFTIGSPKSPTEQVDDIRRESTISQSETAADDRKESISVPETQKDGSRPESRTSNASIGSHKSTTDIEQTDTKLEASRPESRTSVASGGSAKVSSGLNVQESDRRASISSITSEHKDSSRPESRTSIVSDGSDKPTEKSETISTVVEGQEKSILQQIWESKTETVTTQSEIKEEKTVIEQEERRESVSRAEKFLESRKDSTASHIDSRRASEISIHDKFTKEDHDFTQDDEEKLFVKEHRSKSVSSISSSTGRYEDTQKLTAIDEMLASSRDDLHFISKTSDEEYSFNVSSSKFDSMEKQSEDLISSLKTTVTSFPAQVVETIKSTNSDTFSKEETENISSTATSTTTITTKADILDASDSIDKLGGKKTPPTVPVSPNIITEKFAQKDIFEQEIIEKVEKSGISTPKESIHSGKSSPDGTDSAASKSVAIGQGSALDTPDSSPKPTSPFPNTTIETLRSEEEHKPSDVSSPNMTRTSTPDTTEKKTAATSESKTITQDEQTFSSKVHTQQYAFEKDADFDSKKYKTSTESSRYVSEWSSGFQNEGEDEEFPYSTSSTQQHHYSYEESQDEIPPQYDSEEIKSAISISSTYKSDPMSTSFYGALPETTTTVVTTSDNAKSVPIPITTTKTVTRTYVEYTSSPESAESAQKYTKYLDEADLDFEKTFQQSSTTTIVSSASTQKSEAVQSSTSTASSITSSSTVTQAQQDTTKDSKDQKDDELLKSFGKPLGLPSPAPAAENDMKTTPKRERKVISNKTKLNNEKNLRKRSESPMAGKKLAPIYIDLAYVPHHGNSYYSHVEFFKKIRARYYVFSGTEPSKEVYNALLEAKQTWEDQNLEVTIIPTYDTDVLGYWVSENEELLAKYRIDLSPSAARCTINLQDHETSCSAYRLEF